MSSSVQDSARTLRTDCETAESPTDGGPSSPQVVATSARAGENDSAARTSGIPGRHVRQTIAQPNAAVSRLDRQGRLDRRIGVPRAPSVPALAGHTTSPTPLRHETSPEWLALRKEVDDVACRVDELLEVGEDGERKYRLM